MKNVNRCIEHTNLAPTLTHNDVEQLVEEAREHEFWGVCVPPFWVKKAKRDIGEANIQLITVVGFPYGYNRTEIKLLEIEKAINDGADEVDVAMNISAFKAAMNWPKIEITKCGKLAHESEIIIKAIIETNYLSDEEIVQLCRWCADAGVDYIQNSTALSSLDSDLSELKLMRKSLPPNVGIKALGDINNSSQVLALLDAGVDRIGTHSGVEIIK